MGVTMHVLSIEDFNHEQLLKLFKSADKWRKLVNNPAEREGVASRYRDRQLCSLFYEPSTRTRTSFEKAALNFGMGIVSTENAREFSSAAKGETIEDTIRVLDQYGFDIIVMRHHETGAAARAAAVSQTPIINGGDGAGEHPSQSLLDAYTVYQTFGRLDNLKIVIGGDLKHGRTVRSLAQLLGRYKNNRLTFVSIPELQIGEDIKLKLKECGTTFRESAEMLEALKEADVVYWTRLQKERLADPSAIPKDGFILSLAALKIMPDQAIIMHPLPRVDEIDPALDTDPRAAYFRQAGNGLYVRMALIDSILRQK
jgi:aspartate carbamoyltransferase catalytic subunit